MTHESERAYSGVQCSSCGKQIDDQPETILENRQSCPRCGSVARKYNVHICETVRIDATLGLKHKRKGVKKPLFESITKQDIFRDKKTLSKLTRIIDRVNDRYFEKITDLSTDEVLRECDEPLSKHRGHGSAKLKK